MRWIITGGSGFIGTNLSMALKRIADEVVVIDLKKPKVDFVDYVKLDLRKDKIDEYVKDGDTVVHLAANIDVNKSVDDPVFDAYENIIATLNVLDSVRGKKACRFIYTSSAAVYGNPRYVPIDEKHPSDPISPYGLSKLTGERYALLYHDLHGVDVRILRLFNVYGPYQDPNNPYAGVITKFMKRLKDNEPLIINGDGKQTRDFVYVGDVVKAVLLAAEREEFSGKVVNIGSGRRTSLIELVEMLFDVTGKKTDVVHREPVKGDIRDSVADVSLARTLGYVPSTSLKEGLSKTWEWFDERG